MRKIDKSFEPKNYNEALKKERLTMRWKSDEGDRMFHKKYEMPASPRATTNNNSQSSQSSKSSQTKSEGNRKWPF